METRNIGAQEEQNSFKLNYKKIAMIFLSKWHWIITCIILALGIAYVYLSSTEQIYSTSAIVKLAENKSELTELVNVGTSAESNRFESESFVIRSPSVLEKAAQNLNYPVTYYIKGSVKKVDIYPSKPFSVDILSPDSLLSKLPVLQVQKQNNSSYQLTYELNNKEFTKRVRFGQLVSVGNVTLKIIAGLRMSKAAYLIKFNTKEMLAAIMRDGLTIASSAKAPSIVVLKMTGTNPAFISDAVNAIIEEYIKNDAERKKQAATQTIEFINDQLGLLSSQVNQSQTALKTYKTNKGIIDLTQSARILLQRVNEYEVQKNTLEIERVSIGQLESEIQQNRKSVTLNLGLEGETESLLSSLIARLNTLISDRNVKLQQFDVRSSVIQQIDSQIDDIRKATSNNIASLRIRNSKIINHLNEEIQKIKSQIDVLPTDEQNLFNLQSKFDINQRIFTFLSEKKLESQISKAATIANVSLVEASKANYSPISPIPSNAYRNAIVLGLAIGLGLIFIVRALNPYIYDSAEVEIAAKVPILGMIKNLPDQFSDSAERVLALINTKSAFAESVRAVRTNLSFLKGDTASKIICVTSEVAGEGKSFVSLNLAFTLSMINKKVLLIASDLRRSRLHHSFKDIKENGLSEYLSHQVNLEAIITDTNIPNLDFISSGKIPPNPSELLHSDLMSELLSQCKANYDYVIVDTAPVGLISDAIPLIKNADINIFVIRSGVSKSTAVQLPGRVDSEFNLNNSCIIMNAFEPNALFSSFYSSDTSSGNYSNYYYADYPAYSSYYGDDIKPKSWWKKITGK